MKKRPILTLAAGVLITMGVFVSSKPQEPAPKLDTNDAHSANGSFEVTERLARGIIQNALDPRFSRETANYEVAHLDGDKNPELIISAMEAIEDVPARPGTAIILILTMLNEEGEYEYRGRVEYTELLRDAPQLKELIDITGDGAAELFVALGYGGASNIAHGFLKVDIKDKKLDWIKLRDRDGQSRDAIFLIGGTVAHSETIQIADIDGNGTKELVELFTQIWEPEESEDAIPNKAAENAWCLARAYQWTGEFFDFNAQLSEQFLNSVGFDCLM